MDQPTNTTTNSSLHCLTELRPKVLHITYQSVKFSVRASPYAELIIRMIFLLWLVAVVSASQDTEQQTDSPHIWDVVDSKTVQFLPEVGAEVEEATETLTVFQEIHKLDDIVMDDTPIVVDNKESASTLEDLELNEISNNLGEDDIKDIINNFIADKDPILQVFFMKFVISALSAVRRER